MKTTHHSLLIVIVMALTTLMIQAQNSLMSTEKNVTPNCTDLLANTTKTFTESTQAVASTSKEKQKVVIITGARFTYPLVQKWIDDYNIINQEVQFVIESRGSSDPAQYDILIEAYEPTEEAKKNREYLYVARYAILLVANSKSDFAKQYQDKGLDQRLIKQLFFHDLFANKEDERIIQAPYTIYTRLQKAGVPITFTEYFGFQQKDIKGKAIAGSDEHLLKAVLRDTTSVTYFPLTVIYNHTSGKPLPGLTVLPVDLNGNNRIAEDEKFFNDLPSVIQVLENKTQKQLNNIPVGYLHLSIDKKNASAEAIEFLQWVIQHGQDDLHAFGYLKPEREKQAEFVSKYNN